MQNTNMVISKTKILKGPSGFACFCFWFRRLLAHHRLGLMGAIFADSSHLITNVFVYHLLVAQMGTKRLTPEIKVIYVLRVSLKRNAKCQLKWCQRGGWGKLLKIMFCKVLKKWPQPHKNTVNRDHARKCSHLSSDSNQAAFVLRLLF